MSTVLMVASARQTYNGQALKTGDQFNALSEEEAADLTAVNMARRVRPVAKLLQPAQPAEYAVKTVEAAVDVKDDADPDGEISSKPKKHGYNRRDLVATKR